MPTVSDHPRGGVIPSTPSPGRRILAQPNAIPAGTCLEGSAKVGIHDRHTGVGYHVPWRQSYSSHTLTKVMACLEALSSMTTATPHVFKALGADMCHFLYHPFHGFW